MMRIESHELATCKKLCAHRVSRSERDHIYAHTGAKAVKGVAVQDGEDAHECAMGDAGQDGQGNEDLVPLVRVLVELEETLQMIAVFRSTCTRGVLGRRSIADP